MPTPQTPTPTLLTLVLPGSASTPILLGIDLLALTPPPHFHGIKNIPPGPHFLYTGTSTSLSLRHGTWFFVPAPSTNSPPPLLLSEWDSQGECLVPVRDQEVSMRWRANLGTIWDRPGALLPYRQRVPGPDIKSSQARKNSDGAGNGEHVRWEHLTDHITPGLLSRVLGQNDWTISTASSARRDADDLNIPGLTKREVSDAVFQGEGGEKELHFLPVDLKRTWRDGAVGRERTDAAKDRSWAFGDLVQKFCVNGDEGEVLGEVQFSFLMVVTVSCFSCLEQWKRLLGMLFTCERAVVEQAEFFAKVIAVLASQLRVGKQDVDEGGLFGEDMRWLQGLFRTFWKRNYGLEDDSLGLVKRALESLEEEVKELYGWDLRGDVVKRGMLELEDGELVEMEMDGAEEEDETGEYAPVVVDLEGIESEQDTHNVEMSIPLR